jgi:hemerythrin-like metal-binding protein
MAADLVNALVQWTPDYAVGVKQLDSEHQALFRLAAKMHGAMLEGKGKAALLDLLSNLVDYTCNHMVHEELLMQRIVYPNFWQHREEHDQFRARVRAMQERAASGELTMTIEVMHFLMKWMKKHIATSDVRIGAYMALTGDRPGAA